jgi:hypothetical protein
MLYFYDSRDILGVTVYPDKLIDTQFYLVPPFPRLRRDKDGKAAFLLTKFVGGEHSSLPKVPVTSSVPGQGDEVRAEALPTLDDEIAGGILTFDTEYTVGEELRERIRTKLEEEVRDKYTRQGRAIPDGFRITLRDPSWTKGEVHLLMEDTDQGLYSYVSKASHPSLLNGNVATFAAVLAPWQASLLQKSLENTNTAPIQVNYRLSFLAALPPVRINIHADATDCYSMYKQYGSEINGGGACSNPDTVVRSIAQHVHSRDVVKITIDSGGLTLDDKTFQALQEMALGMVQEWIKAEFYKPLPERASKEQIQNIQLRSLSESDFRSLNIDIEQSATVELTFNPQGTLGRLVREGESLAQYFHEVNLDEDEFFQKRRLGIKVYADFPLPGAPPLPTDVRFVEVTAYYGDGAGLTHTWDATGSGTVSATGDRWLAEWHKVPGELDVRWEARVQFRDPSKTMLMQGTSQNTELNIPIVTPGRARLRLGHVGLPWNIVELVEATVNFRQENADPREIERRFIISGEVDPPSFDEAIWVERTQPFSVTLSYRLKNGNVIQLPEHRAIEVKGNQLDILSPFEHYLTVSVVAAHLTPDWVEDIVELKYQDEPNQYEVSTQLILSEKGGWRQLWSVPLLDPANKSFRYSWLRKNREGIFRSADVVDAPPDGWFRGQETTPVQAGDPDADEDMLRVAVDPMVLLVGLDDPTKEVIRAVVHLKYVQPNGVVDVDDHVFNQGDVAWTWKKHILDKHRKTFAWWAEYYTKPFSRVTFGTEANPFTSNAETVVLEPPQVG